MTTKDLNDGGPAWPHSFKSATAIESRSFDGMSLRDWLAGQALAGCMASDTVENHFPTVEAAAEQAYKLADAMLKARGK